MKFSFKKGIAVAAVMLMGSALIPAPAAAATYTRTAPTRMTTTYKTFCTNTISGLRWLLAQWSFQLTPAKQTPSTTTKQITPAKPTTPTTGTSTGAQTAAEQQMLNLINQERAKAGLQPLQADPQLTNLARLKSADMINNNYFSHQSPTYGSPFDMLRKYGVTYRTAGENIAGNQSVQAAHNALMNSPGHRANILNPNFTHVGIGIQYGGPYGMMFTQLFVGR